MFQSMDESLQCAFLTRSCIERYLPCDVTAYDDAYPQLGGDFVWEVLLALVKEPKPTQLLLEQIKQPPADQGQLTRGRQARYVRYGTIFVTVCRAMDGCLTPGVWKNLNGPGKVPCFMGFVYRPPVQQVSLELLGPAGGDDQTIICGPGFGCLASSFARFH